MVKQSKSTIKPPFNPDPYSVVEVKGTQAVLEWKGGKLKSFNKVKVVKKKEKKERGRSD